MSTSEMLNDISVMLDECRNSLGKNPYILPQYKSISHTLTFNRFVGAYKSHTKLK